MRDNKTHNYISDVLENMPSEWLNLTTHRLDIYDESKAKTQFLEQFEKLFNDHNADPEVLNKLPTAYDYVRLGHPLSCVLEWSIAKSQNVSVDNVISFSSQTIPVLAILRKNSLEHKRTRILHKGKLPFDLNTELLEKVYNYPCELQQIQDHSNISAFDGTTIFISQEDSFESLAIPNNIDFFIISYTRLGSILLVNGSKNESYISEIQHVRRRETIAMTPANCSVALKAIASQSYINISKKENESNKHQVIDSIKKITGTTTKALVGSSGLSIQYAIMMGLIDDALETHHGKQIKIVVPPNCYGGTNDQARRVAEVIENVDVVDLPVDGGNDMVKSIDVILNQIAAEDAVPYIIAEIPTNPRVEVPELVQLQKVLSRDRKTTSGQKAIDPVFILDQTFCPNFQFLGEGKILSNVKAISYVSGSKFPSGGLCTAGYCVGNNLTENLIEKVGIHLIFCDNEATDLQIEILANRLPSMNQRISDAYKNTRDFVNFISKTLPEAKINFVSEELAEQGFTPSVFSLDLPTKGSTDEERETYKRELNHKLINLMITEIPNESKYCVSYGQLKGCYWTIPATSTQGTTKEGDKDYIARVALSSNMDLDHHKKVFSDFVESISS